MVKNTINMPMVKTIVLIRKLRKGLDRIEKAIISKTPIGNFIQVSLPTTGKTAFIHAFPSLSQELVFNDISNYEGHTIRIWSSLCSKADVILDIGANVGIFSLVAADANKKARVFAFEPMPENYSCLVENISSASLDGRIKTFQAALSKTNGKMDLILKGRSGPTLATNFWKDSSQCKRISVDVFSLDSWARTNGIKLTEKSLIKIDVETHEPEVFNGAAEALSAGPAIQCEVLATFVEEKLSRIFKASRWRYFWIGPEGLSERKKIIGDPSWHFNNYLFLTKDSPYLRLLKIK